MTTSPQPRTLRFDSIDQARAEVARLLAADRAGTLTSVGAWTAGQIFGHLASWIEWGYDGYPPSVKTPPWILRVILKLMKHSMLNKPMRRGVRLPGVRGGTYGTEPCETQAGGARLLKALDRLTSTPPTFPSLALGLLTLEEATKLHLRHCELHLGYLSAP